jgi:hypothetical protein
MAEQGNAMGNDERVPPIDRINTLVFAIDAMQTMCRIVPSRLQSDPTRLTLLMALREFELIRDEGGAIEVRGWPPAVETGLVHLWE